jgi:hypothetical protein
MPEVTSFIPWEHREWDNMKDVWKSGAVGMTQRPYYYKKVIVDGKARLLIISAVDKKEPEPLKATDYLRIGREEFRQLVHIGRTIFGLQSF